MKEEGKGRGGQKVAEKEKREGRERERQKRWVERAARDMSV